MVFEIEGLMQKPRWYDIKCTCDHSDVTKEYPIVKCLHCKFQYQEDLMPRESFELKMSKINDDDTVTVETKTCNKIRINRGTKYQEIIGWYNIV